MNDTLLNSHDVKIIAAVGREGRRGKHSARKCQSLWTIQPNSNDLLCSFYHCSLAHQRHLQSVEFRQPRPDSQTPPPPPYPNWRFWQFAGSVAGLGGPGLSFSLALFLFFLNASWALQLAQLWIQRPWAGLWQPARLALRCLMWLQKACTTFVFFNSKRSSSVCGHGPPHTWG